MEFRQRKLPREAAADLRQIQLREIEPYQLMLSPIYVYMPRNEKFVSVKGPLDFFTAEELQKISSLHTLYVPPFVDSLAPFATAGRKVRALLTWEAPNETLPPAPFEVSDSVLRAIGPLWSYGESGPSVEPFFVVAFVNELCGVLPAAKLKAARDADVGRYENAVLSSSWVVFLALHIGYLEFDALQSLRLSVFDAMVAGGEPAESLEDPELAEFLSLADESLSESCVKRVRAEFFLRRGERSARKLAARLARIGLNFALPGAFVPTIFGERGFADG